MDLVPFWRAFDAYQDDEELNELTTLTTELDTLTATLETPADLAHAMALKLHAAAFA